MLSLLSLYTEASYHQYLLRNVLNITESEVARTVPWLSKPALCAPF